MNTSKYSICHWMGWRLSYMCVISPSHLIGWNLLLARKKQLHPKGVPVPPVPSSRCWPKISGLWKGWALQPAPPACCAHRSQRLSIVCKTVFGSGLNCLQSVEHLLLSGVLTVVLKLGTPPHPTCTRLTDTTMVPVSPPPTGNQRFLSRPQLESWWVVTSPINQPEVEFRHVETSIYKVVPPCCCMLVRFLNPHQLLQWIYHKPCYRIHLVKNQLN